MDKYDFGNKLYEYRTQKGLTQKELGKLLGVTDKAVSKWETGESKPRLDKMNQITELFETSIDGMLGKETADGEHLKPFKTIFETRLEKYSKYYKAARIIAYIFALVCVLFSVIAYIFEILDGELASEGNGYFIGTILLSSAAVIFTLKFKPKFNECKSRDMNIILIFSLLLFFLSCALPVISAVKLGRITGEYDSFTIGFICAEALILAVIALISFFKKKYYFFTYILLIFTVNGFVISETLYSLTILAIAAQFACFIEKRNWLALANKANIEFKKADEEQKATNAFIAIVAIITVLGIAFSSFSPYIIYKMYLKDYYSLYEKDTKIDYDYSAKFDEELTEIEFEGAKFSIPKGYKELSRSDGIVFYKDDKTNGVISISYYPNGKIMQYNTSDEADIEFLEPSESEEVNAGRAELRIADSLFQKYFGVSANTYYGFKHLIYTVNIEDVKFYEYKKAAFMCGIIVMKSGINTEDSMAVSSFDNGMYCSFVEGRPLSKGSVIWCADVWHSNNKEGAHYSITYSNRGKTNLTDNQMICKLVNSLEF